MQYKRIKIVREINEEKDNDTYIETTDVYYPKKDRSNTFIVKRMYKCIINVIYYDRLLDCTVLKLLLKKVENRQKQWTNRRILFLIQTIFIVTLNTNTARTSSGDKW